MYYLFCFLDTLLMGIMLFDTLGVIYLFRKKENVSKNEYNRVCTSWILFLTIYNLFSCRWRGVIGTLIRLIMFVAKAYVTIPKLGGAEKLHKILIEKDQALNYFNSFKDKIMGILCKKGGEGGENVSDNQKTEGKDFCESETKEPESRPGDYDDNKENI